MSLVDIYFIPGRQINVVITADKNLGYGDIDRPDDEAYANSYFFNANSRQAPQVVDSHVQPILDQSEVYSGCYGKISVTFYGYNSNGNRGIAAGLGNIQKLRDGESLGGRTTAAEDFETEEDEDFLA